ncbi:MAG: ExeA family protein [Acidiferrobacteraceae bacterium]
MATVVRETRAPAQAQGWLGVYEAYYEFREKPFSINPDPAFLYLSPKHQAALDLLEYGLMTQAGFVVVTGDIGSGKTTLIRYFLEQLGKDVNVGLLTNTHQSFGELLRWVLFAFNLPNRGKDKVEMFQDFLEFLIAQYAQRKRTVLIVDEAQNMSIETLEELRMLSNINADKDQVLQVILAGQPELRETLRRPDLAQFAQRIAVDCHLEALGREETEAYIRYRIKVAGGHPELFDQGACHAVYAHTSGVPRLVNLLCDMALVYGYAEQRRRIDSDLVNDAAQDRKRGGLFRPPAKASSATLRTLVTAVKQTRRVSIQYHGQPKPRVVEPHAIYTDGNGELIAECYQIRGYSSASRRTPYWRLFRVDKISDSELLDESFSPRYSEGFNVERQKYRAGLVAVIGAARTGAAIPGER